MVSESKEGQRELVGKSQLESGCVKERRGVEMREAWVLTNQA